MHPARIAELLEPFLGPATTPNHCHSESGQATTPNHWHSESGSATTSNVCHSEPGQRPGEEPAVPPSASDQRLTTSDLEHISTYIDILLRWNARISLTAIRDPEQVVTRHFGESLFAARHLFPRVSPVSPVPPVAKDFENADNQRPLIARPEQREGPRVADLGSGAGFPGLPIKLWAPHISLTLIESNHKKAAFLREVARALTLTDVNILTTRAEALSPATLPARTLAAKTKTKTMTATRTPATTYDVVTLRAVERFQVILPTAASLVAAGGRLALLIGSAQQAQARAILPTLSWHDPIHIPISKSRILTIAEQASGGKPDST